MPFTSEDLREVREDAVQSDPEVREARAIAEAARARLLACVLPRHEVIDLAEAQRMLDALREARTLAEDAGDLVLVHRGLLTAAEAERRAAARRAAARRAAPAGGPGPNTGSPEPDADASGAGVLPFRLGYRTALPVIEPMPAARAVAHALLPVAAGLAGAALACRLRRR